MDQEDTLITEQIADLEALLARKPQWSLDTREHDDLLVIGALIAAAPALIAMAKQTHEAFKISLMYQDRAEKAEAERDNLLAIIHQDGGHHTGEVGISQSVSDAHATWAHIVAERDRYREIAVRLVKCCFDAALSFDPSGITKWYAAYVTSVFEDTDIAALRCHRPAGRGEQS